MNKAEEILRIIFNAPFILETLYKKGELGNDAMNRYMWAQYLPKMWRK